MLNQEITQLLRLPAVLKSNGRSKGTLYRSMKAGLFPQSIQLGPKSVAWPADEVAAINRALIAGKSEDEIRALVKKLEAKRKAA